MTVVTWPYRNELNPTEKQDVIQHHDQRWELKVLSVNSPELEWD